MPGQVNYSRGDDGTHILGLSPPPRLAIPLDMCHRHGRMPSSREFRSCLIPGGAGARLFEDYDRDWDLKRLSSQAFPTRRTSCYQILTRMMPVALMTAVGLTWRTSSCVSQIGTTQSCSG